MHYNPKQTVHVVDDEAGIRDSLRWLFSSVNIAVETYDSADAFLTHWNPSQPGCLVLDLRMPGMSGLELQQYLKSQSCELPIIFISAHGDIDTAVRAMQAGALQFLTKPFSDEVLLEYVKRALAMDARRRADRLERVSLKARLELLTTRERQILDQIVAGKHNKDIAETLDISVKTTEMHRANLMRKMHANSIAELVRLYLTATATTGNTGGSHP